MEESELNLNTIPQGINSSNLDEIEYMVSQNKLEYLSQNLSNDEEDNLSPSNSEDENDEDSKMIKQILCQDLQEHCGTDEATFHLINMMKFSDDVHEGKDEETINLVTKLNHETQLENEIFEQERYKRVKAATTKTNENFPPLPKANQ